MLIFIALYLDPGSGSFLLQLLIAGLAGAGIAIGAQWTRIKKLFSKKGKNVQDENDEDESDDE
jgi:hypothetical protein